MAKNSHGTPFQRNKTYVFGILTAEGVRNPTFPDFRGNAHSILGKNFIDAGFKTIQQYLEANPNNELTAGKTYGFYILEDGNYQLQAVGTAFAATHQQNTLSDGGAPGAIIPPQFDYGNRGSNQMIETLSDQFDRERDNMKAIIQQQSAQITAQSESITSLQKELLAAHTKIAELTQQLAFKTMLDDTVKTIRKETEDAALKEIERAKKEGGGLGDMMGSIVQLAQAAQTLMPLFMADKAKAAQPLPPQTPPASPSAQGGDDDDFITA